MSALTVDHEPDNGHGYDWDELVRIWEETEGPEGWKVEVIEGIVTMAPPPANDHNDTVDELQRLLYTVIPRDWGIYQTQGVSVPGRSGLYIPDLAVIPKAALKAPNNRVPAGEARLVVEVTSKGNAAQDRVAKLRGYAHAGVPLYLLLDAWHSGSPTTSGVIDRLPRLRNGGAMTTTTTRSTLDELLSRMGEGEHAADRIAELFAPTVDWLAPGSPAVPWIRDRSTRADAADFFRTMLGHFVPEDRAAALDHVLVDGPHAVVTGRVTQRLRTNGRLFTTPFALHITVEGGLITRYRVYEDSLTVAEAYSYAA
jgi:ketosteroid isomerase-like protein/Uma2 family endonuclease